MRKGILRNLRYFCLPKSIQKGSGGIVIKSRPRPARPPVARNDEAGLYSSFPQLPL
jgi:hypothetical protein